MLEIINAYIKYVYYLLGIILVVVLMMLLKRLINISKAYKQCLKGVDDINKKFDVIKQKTDYLKKSFSTSWAFFIEIIAIVQIIKIVFRDYKGTPKAKRSLVKSAATSVLRSPSTITKLKKLA